MPCSRRPYSKPRDFFTPSPAARERAGVRVFSAQRQ